MYRCIPPTPSSLCGTLLAIFGIYPRTVKPVESVRYRPTTPLELASPLGDRLDFEFRSSRADSHALAASTTMRARIWYSRLSWVFTYEIPVARPASLVVTSRVIAFVMIFSRPVRSAGGRSTDGDEKFAWTLQPRPHSPQ